MGAVRRLATVVIVGLVAISTFMVVYLAAEPDRRSDETEVQDVVAIERGTDLYITYCLQCHGPAGLGAIAPEEPRRIGAALNQAPIYGNEEQLKEALDEGRINVIYQTDDPVLQNMTEDWLRFRIIYGVPAEPTASGKIMPAFGNDLNVEELNDLVYLIMHGDWNYVYNASVKQTGQQVAEQECAENPDAEYCDDITEAPAAYPTVPGAEEASGGDEATPDPANETGDENGSTSIGTGNSTYATNPLTIEG